MKAEVLLRRRGETKIENGSMDLNVSMETEQYSPSDFINHLVTEDNQAHISSLDDGCLLTRQHGAKLSQQTVIRPIPIMPIDSSVYTSPPTYIDNIPTAVTVPMMHAPLLTGHLTKSQGHILSANQEVEVCPTSNSVGKSKVGSESMRPSSQDMLDCKWMNCEQQFRCMDDLVMHVNDHHVRVERPDVEYQCKWGGCPRKGKGFNARYKMLIHIRTHTNEKPHKCSQCGKSFSRLENLKIHMRSHTGEKPYSCPFEGCNKAYSNSSDRFKHVRTHQEDKPYICKMPGCNKRYTDPSSLRKHVRTHGHHYKDAVKENAKSSSESNLIQESNNNELTRTNNAHSIVETTGNRLVPVSKNGSKTSVARHHESSGIHFINISSLISNPFLSSTIVPISSREILSQADTPFTCSVKQQSVDTQSIIRHAENLKHSTILPKSQEIPLDLSVSPSSSESCGTGGEITASFQSPKLETGPSGIGRWEVIHLSS